MKFAKGRLAAKTMKKGPLKWEVWGPTRENKVEPQGANLFGTIGSSSVNL